MSIFDTIREFFGGQAEELTQQVTEQLPVEDIQQGVQDASEQAGQVGEDVQQQVEDATQNIQDKFPQ